MYSKDLGTTIATLLDPVSAANTAAATSAWVAVTQPEGVILFALQVGAMTGSIAWTIETASDDQGANLLAITPIEGAFSAGAANQSQKRSIDARQSKGYVRCKGTIGTGPSVVAGTVLYQSKYA
jgi:hypothetical protein